jgi:iron complex transport system permease protein
VSTALTDTTPHPPAPRPNAPVLFMALAGLAGLSFVAALVIGAVPVAVGDVLAALLPDIVAKHMPWLGADSGLVAILDAIRIPRAVLALVIGAALAVAGAGLQGLFRNPLVDPGLIGVTGGASLAAGLAIVAGDSLIPLIGTAGRAVLLPLAAFGGGLLATLIAFVLARRASGGSAAILLLAGVAVNAMTLAGMGLLSYFTSDQQLRELTFWTLGSLSGTSWERCLPAMLLMAAGAALVFNRARALDAFLLGESEARHLGVDSERLKRHLVLGAALAVGAAVSVSGGIGFVGLVVPHVVRMITGPGHRLVLPASALLGAALLSGADIVCRTVVVPAELPIGVVTALAGGPFFLWLLLSRKGYVL